MRSESLVKFKLPSHVPRNEPPSSASALVFIQCLSTDTSPRMKFSADLNGKRSPQESKQFGLLFLEKEMPVYKAYHAQSCQWLSLSLEELSHLKGCLD